MRKMDASVRKFGSDFRFWILILVAIIVTTPAALGVHEVMLETLHIPYPRPIDLATWASYLNTFLSTLALVVFSRFAAIRLSRYTLIVRCLIVSLLYVMLHETLRVLFIDIKLTNAWAFQSMAALPSTISSLTLCSVVVVVAPYLKPLWAKVLAAGAISALAMFAAKPTIDMVFAPLLKKMAHMDFPQIYFEPFPWQVFIPIYVGFIEPVIASLALAALIWPSLSTKALPRLLQFVAIIMFMKGSVLPTMLWSFWIKAPLPQAMLSEAQFGLETLVLAFMTGGAWQILHRQHALLSASPSGGRA